MSMYYTIREDRLVQFLDSEQRLAALEAAGVDNWEGMDAVDRSDDADINDMLATFSRAGQA